MAFCRSTEVLNPKRPSAADEKLASIAYVLLVTISFVMTQGLANAQPSSAQPEALLPSSSSKEALLQPGSLDEEVTTPCSLRVRDSIPLAPVKGNEATTANGPFAYPPLSDGCKFNLFLASTYSPYTFASAGFQATLAHVTGQWPHYGGGMQGWGKRLGATLADTESRRFIQTFALSTILHQDPRYFPSHQRTFISRAWYAATRVVVTRNDDGDSTFNTSEFLGALFTSSLQNAYYPRHDRNFGATMNRFSGALASDAIGYIQREFTPDMKSLFRKHAPKKILQIEEKLPIPAEDKL
jgi:hypothetical protein